MSRKIHIGVHVSAVDAAKISADHGFSACQIFTVVPQQVKLVTYDAERLRRAAHAGLHIWTHSSYLVSPWGSKPYNMPMCIKQLKQNAEFAGCGVIFHLPKAPATMIAPKLHELIRQCPAGTRVVLENKAVRPAPMVTYETPEKINALIDHLIQSGIPRRHIWFAIDTAHLYCSGVRLHTRADAEQWLAALKYPDRIAAFHLNGNSSRTFSDRHTIAFGPDDLIWGRMKFESSGVAAIRDFCVRHAADIIIECDFDQERDAARALIKRIRD